MKNDRRHVGQASALRFHRVSDPDDGSHTHLKAGPTRIERGRHMRYDLRPCRWVV